ncbi:MAG: cyclic nucleotide-binding domain-containing protein [Proteobacteria bacterium]|nr:cyclic nucleotide-binding domain-containing protein [Pseudomonadota bacterium]
MSTNTQNGRSASDFSILQQRCTLFAGVDAADLSELIRQSAVTDVEAGDAVLLRGQTVEFCFLLLEGRLAALIAREWGEERIINTIEPGGMVGEIELLGGEKAVAEVRAMEGSRLLKIDLDTLTALARKYPPVWREMSDLARQRRGRLLLIRHISRLFGTGGNAIEDPLLRLEADEDWLNFEEDILGQLERRVEWTELARGDFLFRQGDAPDGAYVLVPGMLAVETRANSGEPRQIARISQGEIVGELGLIVDAERSASVIALRDCELFRIAPDVFNEVTQRYPRRMVNVYRSITERFYRNVAVRPFRSTTANVAVLTASESIDIATFNRELLPVVEQYETIECLDSGSVDQALGHPGVASSREGDFENSRLTQWLNSVEAESGRVIYQGDQNWSIWNERCVRQADEVLVLADAGASPDLTAIRCAAVDPAQIWRLVLVHPPGTERPWNTARWLKDSRIASVYHVKKGDRRDMARLARLISGHSYGLVLGGGGARGFAHLGVLRALEELDIPVDRIGGTSIGAPIAGWVAQGKNAEECTALAKRVFNRLIDVTLPRTSIIAGKRISDVIRNETATWDIEDYWLPFFCVSTSLTRFEPRVHLSGNSARAIRASVSIPGILPPVPEGDELLVDGGVINNLPMDVMRQINGNGPVLAIDVVSPSGMFSKGDYGLSVSGWRQTLRQFLPWNDTPSAPPIASIITQAMMVGSSHAREQLLHDSVADYYQNIHVPGIGLLQFDAVREAAKIGYEQCRGPLAEWLRNS